MDTNALLKELNDMQTEMQNKMQAALSKLFSEFFEKHPEVKTIYWSQWQSFFNDGDPCYFHVNEVCFSPMEWKKITNPYHFDNYEGDDYEADFSYYDNEKTSTELKEDMRNIEKFISSKHMREVMERTYQNHSFVRVHKDGVEQEEWCDHS